MFARACMLPALALVTSLIGPISATAQAQAGQLALKETAVITAIEDHGAAGDLSADRLGEAGLTMLRARSACYQGRESEALALYEGILDLGPVASLRTRH
jgi:hypothetical protein